MTATADLKEFIAAYLVEAEEHLAVANAQLLAVESAQRKGETNPRAVRETFRSLHTIKGLSAMVGHRTDRRHRASHGDVPARDFDRSGGALPLEAIDALLKGVRAIEQRVLALSRGDSAAEPSDELLTSLDSLGLAAASPAAHGCGHARPRPGYFGQARAVRSRSADARHRCRTARAARRIQPFAVQGRRGPDHQLRA